MITCLYRSGAYTYNYASEKKFSGGMIATFDASERTIRICDDNSVPVGFFVNNFDNSTRFTDDIKISVFVGQGEYQTDVFEDSEYKENDFLYCSCNGKITNERIYRGNIIVGIANFVSKDQIGFISCFARGLEKPIRGHRLNHKHKFEFISKQG